MEKAGIKIAVESRVADIKDNTLKVVRAEAEETKMVDYAFDLVVWAGGRMSNQELVQQIKQIEAPFDLKVIGDVKSVGKIHDAIYDGYTAIAAC